MQYVPDLAEFRSRSQGHDLIVVYREIVDDADTPVSAFAKLRASEWSFLLESVVGAEKWATYSFVGVAPRAVLRARAGQARIDWREPESPAREEQLAAPDAAAAVAALLARFRVWAPPGLPRFYGGAVGCLAYDAVRAFEKLPARAPDELGLDDAVFVLTDTVVVFDNLRQTLKVVATARADGGDAAHAAACARIDAVIARLRGPAPALRVVDAAAAPSADVEVTRRSTPEEYMAAVVRAKEYILAGDAFQVVLSQRFEVARGDLDPFDVYRALRVINPSPYMFHLDFPGAAVTGASPEVVARLEAGRVTVRPIAGTRRRGASEAEDARLEAELLADPKERAEHIMLIDLGRNDVGRVSKIGSVHVDETMVVERYSHVMHMVSHVTGDLADGLGPLDVLRASFPTGTLSGAPKIRAMEIIEELEPTRRGLYGGAVGYLSYAGNMDFAIAIRTLVTQGDKIFVQAGAGIVHDSVPAAEHEECMSKARAVLRAVAAARGGV